MKIYKYKDYDEYIEWQIRTNKSKAGWVYVNDPLDATLNEIVNLVEEIGMVISNRIAHNVSAGGTVLVCKRG